MKVLSVRDPWATLIARGVKDVENRSWRPKYRGPLAIAASTAYDRDAHLDPVAAAAMVTDDRVRKLSVKHDFHPGHIIAVVDLVGVHLGSSLPGHCWHDDRGMQPACSLWGQPALYHLELAKPRLLPEPIPHRGLLSIRDLPDAVIRQIHSQLGDQHA